MSDDNEHALEISCPSCRHSMALEFQEEFHPKDRPDVRFRCPTCGQRFKITNWAPIWIVRDLDARPIARA